MPKTCLKPKVCPVCFAEFRLRQGLYCSAHCRGVAKRFRQYVRDLAHRYSLVNGWFVSGLIHAAGGQVEGCERRRHDGATPTTEQG